ncbi:hypothetical protein [Streptomyces sp. NPDC048340]|uniref:hypothetical protein n=1 Tax=Streptomyces sp. NPDC048340 TaxID=3365537 RepID=UPI00371401AA
MTLADSTAREPYPAAPAPLTCAVELVEALAAGPADARTALDGHSLRVTLTNPTDGAVRFESLELSAPADGGAAEPAADQAGVVVAEPDHGGPAWSVTVRRGATTIWTAVPPDTARVLGPGEAIALTLTGTHRTHPAEPAEIRTTVRAAAPGGPTTAVRFTHLVVAPRIRYFKPQDQVVPKGSKDKPAILHWHGPALGDGITYRFQQGGSSRLIGPHDIPRNLKITDRTTYRLDAGALTKSTPFALFLLEGGVVKEAASAYVVVSGGDLTAGDLTVTGTTHMLHGYPLISGESTSQTPYDTRHYQAAPTSGLLHGWIESKSTAVPPLQVFVHKGQTSTRVAAVQPRAPRTQAHLCVPLMKGDRFTLEIPANCKVFLRWVAFGRGALVPAAVTDTAATAPAGDGA